MDEKELIRTTVFKLMDEGDYDMASSLLDDLLAEAESAGEDGILGLIYQ